jgi:chaperonin cofactor prefoldin
MDEETRDQVHRVEVRLERLETKIDDVEKTLGDFRSELRTRLEGIENRIARKAETWLVGAASRDWAC